MSIQQRDSIELMCSKIYELIKDIDYYKARKIINNNIENNHKHDFEILQEKNKIKNEENLCRELVNQYDEKRFWGRRASSLLAIGNGAGTLGVGSFLSNAQNLKITAHEVSIPFVIFLVGTLSSAITPFAKSVVSNHKIRSLEQQLINDSDKWAGRASAQAESAETFWGGLEFFSVQVSLWCFLFAILILITNIMNAGS